MTPILEGRCVDLPADARGRLVAVIPAVKDGAKTLVDLADLSLFAVSRSGRLLISQPTGPWRSIAT